MNLSFDWDDRQFDKEMKKLLRAFTTPSSQGAVGKAVLLAGQRLLADSQEIVPFDTGDLQKSGSADDLQPTSGGMEIEVGYNKVYAAKLHEDMTLNISQSKAGLGGKPRQQKYLETPMKANAKFYGNMIALNILKRL